MRVLRPSDWHLDALCAQVDPEIFFPEKGYSAASARSICARCEVKDRCLAEALDNKERFGVWGGTVPQERLEILRRDDPTFDWAEAVVPPYEKSRGGPWSENRTHCNRGHELTPENVIVGTKGRRCRECKRIADNRYRRSRWEQHRENQVVELDVRSA